MFENGLVGKAKVSPTVNNTLGSIEIAKALFISTTVSVGDW